MIDLMSDLMQKYGNTSFISKIYIANLKNIATLSIHLDAAGTQELPATNSGLWRLLSILQGFSLLSGGRQLPVRALQLLDEFLGECPIFEVVGSLATATDTAGGAGRVMWRRDLLCLRIGPRHENHYHSSLKTREWAFALPHDSPPESDTNNFVSWRYSQFSSVRHLLCWWATRAALELSHLLTLPHTYSP